MYLVEMNSRTELLDKLSNQLTLAAAPPFLFVGSGFSKRYLGLPSWAELLSVFCENIRPFKYYHGKANGDMPYLASLMADAYFEHAWSDPEKSKILEGYEIGKAEDVLKFFISKYIDKLYVDRRFELQFPEEVQKLEKLSVDAIITTNWDRYLEDIFPEYSTYVGQDEIVVSNPYGIGEIYKIHGSVNEPSSLVLTRDDYHEFNKKYAYLASKLLTYLIEHPIIFIGYSLQDENIKKILESLAMCLGDSVQERLRNNLIFVQRNGKGRREGIETTSLKIEDRHIPLTTVTTDDFGVIYDAINVVKRKIPARILRFLKEEIYEITKTNDPKAKICVTDIDDIEDKQSIEFVVGVGVKEIHRRWIESQTSEIGYHPIAIESILEDVLRSEDAKSEFHNLDMLLKGTLPYHISRSANTPIFKYLRMKGIGAHEGYKSSGYLLDRAYKRKFEQYRIYSQVPYNFEIDGGVTEIIENNLPQKAAILIPHLNPKDIDVDELKAFLMTYLQEWNTASSTYRSAFRKLVTIYDRIKYGWIDAI